MSHTVHQDPTKVYLFERDSSSSAHSTDSNGCLVCPTNPTCPKCGDNESCQFTVRSCQSCASAYCVANNNTSSSTVNIGAIVGGVVGGFVLLLLISAGLLYYKFVYQKKSIMLEDDKDIVMSGMNNDNESAEYSISNMESNAGDPKLEAEYNAAARVRPPTRPDTNRRLSSYESFTRPKRPTARRNASRNISAGSKLNKSTGRQQISDNASSRNSIATTISTTNASNILPIAYIPGVTVRPTKNNTRSIYSYDSESLFSDLNTIENASIVGDVVKAKNLNGREIKNTTTTAIKAQPRLVNVDRIEEEDEDEEEEDDELYPPIGNKSNTSDINTTSNLNGSTLSVLPIQVTKSGHESNDASDSDSDIDGDSDVDSDIGEITRATSVRKNRQPAKEVNIGPEIQDQSEDIYVEVSQLDNTNIEPVQQPAPATSGGFILDLAIDSDSESENSKSPFDDQ